MRKFLSSILLFSLPFIAFPQSAIQRILSIPDTSKPCENYFELNNSLDGNYLVFQQRCKSNNLREMWVQKLDTSFIPLLLTRIVHQSQPGSFTYYLVDAIEMPDTSIILLIHTSDVSSINLIRLNKMGQFESYNRYVTGSNATFKFEIDHFGGDSLILSVVNPNNPTQSGYIMLDPLGNVLYNRFLSCNSQSTGHFETLIASDKSIILFQSFFDNSNMWQPAITKFDSAGMHQWTKLYQDTTKKFLVNDVIELTNGNFIACGYVETAGWTTDEGFLICLSNTGQLLWTKSYAPQSMIFHKLKEIGSDSIFVSANLRSDEYGINILFDANGNVIDSYGFDDEPFLFPSNRAIIDNDRNVISVTSKSATTPYLFSKSKPFGLIHCGSFPVNITQTNLTLNQSSSFVLDTITVSPAAPNISFAFEYILPGISNTCNPSGVDEQVSDSEKIKVIPNPAHDFIHVIIPESMEIRTYILTDALGKIVSEGILTGNETNLNFENLNSGIYLFKIYGNHFSAYEKIVLY